VARAGGFLESILLGDGDIPLLGDGWRGEVDVARLLERARTRESLRAPAEPHAVSGVAALARGPLRLVARAGAHGPDHQLGHAHADLLSFDLSAGERRVVTDTGTGVYAAGPLRDALRSTAAHNTIQLDGKELLEAWSSFRSGRRGRATALARGADARFAWLAATHDGYVFLPGAPRPHRLWLLAEDALWIVDVVLGTGRHRITSRLHLHPDAPAAVEVAAIGAELRRESTPLHERFGEARPMARLVVEAESALPWAGGFRIGFGADDATPPALAFDGGVARLVARDFAVAWRVGARDAAAVAIEARAS
jgi:hypothetical protein